MNTIICHAISVGTRLSHCLHVWKLQFPARRIFSSVASARIRVTSDSQKRNAKNREEEKLREKRGKMEITYKKEKIEKRINWEEKNRLEGERGERDVTDKIKKFVWINGNSVHPYQK